jgi:hypothetical protein
LQLNVRCVQVMNAVCHDSEISEICRRFASANKPTNGPRLGPYRYSIETKKSPNQSDAIAAATIDITSACRAISELPMIVQWKV